MGRGRWSRWGKGSCEGYGLELGPAFYATVVRRDQPHPEPPLWQVMMNSGDLGRYPDRESAKRRAEQILEDGMRRAVEDWEYYLHSKSMRAATRI
jgi:hypothetical protein